MSQNRRRMLMGEGNKGAGGFGGLMFSPGPLVYRNNQFELQSAWNEVNSYGSIYGVQNGSTYFSYYEIGQQFDSHGSSFSGTDIDNANTLSFDGYNDWRVPTRNEFKILLGIQSGYTRNGSTVNGNIKKHYSRITTNIRYGSAQNIKGYLFFPDNQVITGKSLSAFDTVTEAASDVTSTELNEYLDQGCIFLPFGGEYYKGTSGSPRWDFLNTVGHYWSANIRPKSEGGGYGFAYRLWLTSSSTNTDSAFGGNINIIPVYLCRNL